MSQRFNHPVLDDFYTALDNFHAAQQLLKEAKEQLHQSAQALPRQCGEDDDLRDEVFHYLYWYEEDAPIGLLKEVFQAKPPGTKKKHPHMLIMRTKAVPTTCYDCKQTFDMEMNSRWGGGMPVCQSCQQRRHTDSQLSMQEYQEQRRQEAARRIELHSMPYWEYLQTPEWQAKRIQALRKAGFRCAICNAYGVRLNVHHRTYERRGFEDIKDLITLCEGCHEIFHENGRLVEQ